MLYVCLLYVYVCCMFIFVVCLCLLHVYVYCMFIFVVCLCLLNVCVLNHLNVCLLFVYCIFLFVVLVCAPCMYVCTLSFVESVFKYLNPWKYFFISTILWNKIYKVTVLYFISFSKFLILNLYREIFKRGILGRKQGNSWEREGVKQGYSIKFDYFYKKKVENKRKREDICWEVEGGPVGRKLREGG